MRRTTHGTVVGLIGVAAAIVRPDAAFASTITQPSTNPFQVQADSSHNPLPFTITATGFPAFTPVFVEQCDGKSPSAAGWDPTIDCDLGTSPAPHNTDANGSVTFDMNNSNFAFHPFRGASPQQLFNCLAPGQANLNNGLPNWNNCQIRVSTNNSFVTGDQSVLGITLPAPK